jgi:hypothetical protein
VFDDRQNQKVIENRHRRAAARQGLRLEKTRRRDTRAWDYGLFNVIDADTTAVLAQHLNIDQVSDYLNGE